MKRFYLLAMSLLWLAATLGAEPLTPEQLAWTSVRVAAVQLPPPARDADPADVVARYIDRAAADKAQLVVFPEYHLGKIRIPGPITDKVAAAARAHRIYVIVGCFEVVDDAGNYRNHALLFGRDGAIIGRYAKMHPAIGRSPYFWPPSGKEGEWLMQKGDEFPVFDLDFGRIGILTCYDGYFPEPFRILSLKGAEILVWINGRGGSIEDYIVKSAMFQDYVSMVCTNQARGSGTMIADYPNRILKICPEAKEDYIVADLDLRHLRDWRKNSRTFHQRRPEVYGEILESYPVWEDYAALPDLPTSPTAPVRRTRRPLR
ncbi:MAG: carbon-nitrogen hydrolase family protein [bacterium]|nr:carbon-nitrogen hydrolase family protein [bacterium]